MKTDSDIVIIEHDVIFSRIKGLGQNINYITTQLILGLKSTYHPS